MQGDYQGILEKRGMFKNADEDSFSFEEWDEENDYHQR